MAFVTALERPRELGRNLAFYLPLYLMIAVINPLFSHNGVTPLFFLNGNPVTLEAVLYGLDIAVMLVAVLYWFKGYSHVMTSDKFLFLFGRAIPRLALVLSTALRFVPLLKVQIRRVGRAQKAMGLYAADSYVDKVKGGCGFSCSSSPGRWRTRWRPGIPCGRGDMASKGAAIFPCFVSPRATACCWAGRWRLCWCCWRALPPGR